MKALHVYETDDGVILRRGGDDTIPIDCKEVNTRVIVEKLENGQFAVQVSLIAPGFATVIFDEWFGEWEEDDNLSPVANGEVNGRFVEVAIRRSDFEQLKITGRTIEPYKVDARQRDPLESRQAIQPDGGYYFAPLVAMKIAGKWVEPVAYEASNSTQSPR